jgi:hypothetical protein
MPDRSHDPVRLGFCRRDQSDHLRFQEIAKRALRHIPEAGIQDDNRHAEK